MFKWDDVLGRKPAGPAGPAGSAGAGGGGKGKKADFAEFDFLTLELYEGVFQGTAGISLYELGGNTKHLLDPVWEYGKMEAAAGNASMAENLQYYMYRAGGDEEKAKREFLTDFGIHIVYNQERFLNLLEIANAPLAKWASAGIADTLKAMSAEQGGSLTDEQLTIMTLFIRDMANEMRFNQNVSDQTFRDMYGKYKQLLFSTRLPGFGEPRAMDEESMARAANVLQGELGSAAIFYYGTNENNVLIFPAAREAITRYKAEEGRLLQSRLKKALRWVGYQPEPGKIRDVIGMGIYEDYETGTQYKMNEEGGKMVIRYRRRGNDGIFSDWVVSNSNSSQQQSAEQKAPTLTKNTDAAVARVGLNQTWFADPNKKPPKEFAGSWETATEPEKLALIDTMSKRSAPPLGPDGRQIMHQLEWQSWDVDKRAAWLQDYYGQQKQQQPGKPQKERRAQQQGRRQTKIRK
jgi:hypothetical protein